MPRHRETLLASAARTISGTGGETSLYTRRDVDAYSRALFVLDVTAASGTAPLLNVYVQMKGPNGEFMDIVSFALMSAVGKRMMAVDAMADMIESPITDGTLAAGTSVHVPLGAEYRIKWTIGGVAPSFTFSVSADIYE